MNNKPGSKRLGLRMQQKAIAIRTRLQPLGKRGLQIARSIPYLAIKLVSHFTKAISNQTINFIESLQLGRIFRRLGLPVWTLLGIGFAGWWFDNAGALIESLIQYLLYFLKIQQNTPDFVAYLPKVLMFLIPCIAVIGIGMWQSYGRKIISRGISGELRKPEGKKGLILLVSNPDSAKFAIDYHYIEKGTLEKVWLIPSNDTEKDKFGEPSISKVDPIEDYCKELKTNYGRPLEVIVHRKGVCPGDAQDTFDYVNRVYRQSGYAEHELIADFTGGTKPMSVGMIMACLKRDRELEYVSFVFASKQSFGPFLIDYQHSAFDLIG
ncbi:hypothetical protein ACE1CI_32895 [Aerosakkonemataceae cyanobacterium BLCC-F50]|uniref:CRISPR-associated protein n=1 Tax=Floridaenema flaviceps BLCC-F50 TaxID=3153642 RepID=A0ABV4Y1Y6_9CYAN